MQLKKIIENQSTELAPTAQSAAKIAEVQGMIVVANRMPRDQDAAIENLMLSCDHPAFAGETTYQFPRGKATITGPSVNLAREAARCWGNIQYSVDVIRDDKNSRLIRAWAWDMQTNTRVSAEDEFVKTVFRKNQGDIPTNERELRELTNRRGAILERNCILKLIPRYVIDMALERAEKTLQKDAASSPEETILRLVQWFSAIQVSRKDLEKRLGHRMEEATPKEISKLRAILRSILDGNSSWAEYAPKPDPNPTASGDSTETAQTQVPEGQQTAVVDAAPQAQLTLDGLQPGEVSDPRQQQSEQPNNPSKAETYRLTKRQTKNLEDTAAKAGMTDDQFTELLGQQGFSDVEEIRRGQLAGVMEAVLNWAADHSK